MPKPISQEDIPEGVKPFLNHGIELNYKPGDKNATGDCPFCGAESKFSVHIETTLWRCWACNEGYEKRDAQGNVKPIKGGNAVEFLRMLWKYSDAATTDYTELIADRKLLGPEALVKFEVAKSITTNE